MIIWELEVSRYYQNDVRGCVIIFCYRTPRYDNLICDPPPKKKRERKYCKHKIKKKKEKYIKKIINNKINV